MTSTNNLKLLEELKQSGFIDRGTVEMVLVTRNSDGSPNAAPMGVKLFDGHLEFRSYRNSRTFENLKRGGRATVNVTHDPLIFLATAFKDEIENQPTILPDLTLSDADSSIILDVLNEKASTKDWTTYIAIPIDIVKRRKHPIVFSRGRASAIEAIIHATRVKVFINEEREAAVEELTRKIEACIEVVYKVSPSGAPERLVTDELSNLMKRWRDQR